MHGDSRVKPTLLCAEVLLRLGAITTAKDSGSITADTTAVNDTATGYTAQHLVTTQPTDRKPPYSHSKAVKGLS